LGGIFAGHVTVQTQSWTDANDDFFATGEEGTWGQGVLRTGDTDWDYWHSGMRNQARENRVDFAESAGARAAAFRRQADHPPVAQRAEDGTHAAHVVALALHRNRRPRDQQPPNNRYAEHRRFGNQRRVWEPIRGQEHGCVENAGVIGQNERRTTGWSIVHIA